MDSIMTQITAAQGPANMDAFCEQMKQQLQSPDAQVAQNALVDTVRQLEEKLDGKTLPELAVEDGFTAEKALEIFPASIISDAVAATGESEEVVKETLLKIFEATFKVKDVFARLFQQPESQDSDADPAIAGIKRVKTMMEDQDIETMDFGPKVDELMELFASRGLNTSPEAGDNSVGDLMKLFASQSLDESPEAGHSPVDMEKLVRSLPLAAIARAIRVPISNSELAEERFAEYRKHVDAFIEAIDDESATPATFNALSHTLHAFPLLFEAREEETCSDLEPIREKICEALAQMDRISAARSYESVGPFLRTMFPQDVITKYQTDLLSAKELKGKWDEIKKEIDAVIAEHEEAEAKAEEQAATELADSLD